MRKVRNGTPAQQPDAVGLVIALLVRFPEIATIVSHPTDGTLTFAFAVAAKLDRKAEREVRDTVVEHVRSLAELAADGIDTLDVACETDARMTFVRVTRDARSVTRDELALLVAMFRERFGPALVSTPAEDSPEDDPAAQDELVDYALDALRDPAQQKSLVGFSEEQRVMVYFTTSRKKPKAKARAR
jgi:hypothetical protein